MNDTIRKITAIVGLSGALLSPAFAQSDDATVDAYATIQTVTPPLAVTGETSLSFGTVNVPNGVVEESICQYELGAISVSGSMSVREVNPNAPTDSSVPTPSGCRQSGSHNLAKFSISCSPTTPVGYSMTWNNNGGIDGLQFLAPGNYKAVATTGGSSSGSTYASGTTFQYNCPASGAADVYVGGLLNVNELATDMSEAVVGSITLSAEY